MGVARAPDLRRSEVIESSSELSYGGMGTEDSRFVNEERVDRRAKPHFLKEFGSLLEGERTPDPIDPTFQVPDRHLLRHPCLGQANVEAGV